jgi:energy-converting hydrogenase Eha subunit F
MFRKMALKTIMKSAIAILAFLLSGWVVQRYTISFPS